VQLAVARGVKVIGTASERNHDYLRSIGATPVTYGDGLLERVRSVAPQGVDAVLDASGRRQSGRRHPRRSLLRQSPTLRGGRPLTAGLLRSRDITVAAKRGIDGGITVAPMSIYETGGGCPSPLAASAASQSQTVQPWR
jgi:hypothetical protein